MLKPAAVLFVLALLMAMLGLSGLAGGAAEVAKVMFFGLLLLGVLSLIAGRRLPA